MLTFAEESGTVQQTNVSLSTLNLIHALGLVTEDEYQPSVEVTRAFAAEVVVRLTGTDTNANAAGNLFYDVSAEDEYAFAIETAVQRGYVKGVGDRRFEPDRYITPWEMSRILFRCVGYTEELNARLPESAMFKGVRTSGNLTYADLVNMLYNTLMLDVLYAEAITGDGIQHLKVDTDTTVLNDVFGVYKAEGVIIENGLTGLYADSDLKMNQVAVDTKDGKFVIDIGATDIDSAIGRYVELYYKSETKNSEAVVISYAVSERKNDIVEISLFDVDYSNTTGNKLEYMDSRGNSNELRYDKETAILYNGTYYAGADFRLRNLEGLEGSITAIDNNTDGVYDVFDIKAYETYVVSSVVLTTGMVHAKNRKDTICLDKSEYDVFSLKTSAGEQIVLEDFIPGTILSVAANSPEADKRVVDAIVNTVTVSGTVNTLETDNNGYQMIRLDDDSEVTYRILSFITDIPSVSQGVTLGLTCFGNVADIDFSYAGDYVFGLVTGMAKDENGVDRAVSLRILDNKKNVVIYKLNGKITIDGDTLKDNEAIYNRLSQIANENKVFSAWPTGVYPIRYRVNKNKEILEIDSPSLGENELEEASLVRRITREDYSIYINGVLGGELAVKTSTPYIRVRTNADRIKEIDTFNETGNFIVSTFGSYYSNKSSGIVAAYSIGKKTFEACLVIQNHVLSSTGTTDRALIIERFTEAYSEETGEKLLKVYGVQGGVETQVNVASYYRESFEKMGFGIGDAIRCKTDANDQIFLVTPAVVHNDTGGIELYNVDGSQGKTTLSDFKRTSNRSQVIYGFVTRRQGDLIEIAYTPPGPKGDSNPNVISGARNEEDVLKDEKVLICLPTTTPVTIYDPSRKNNIVYAGTYDEILDYENYGKQCSLVGVVYENANIQEVIVFNDYSLYEK